MIFIYIVIVVVAIILLWSIVAYNRFVTFGNRVREASSDISVQEKRRYDLIPNLVETVKGYAAHESGTLTKVTEMRTRAMNATTPTEKTDAENQLSGALKTLFAVSENYPDLKANQNFLELQRELEDTENKLQAARRFYNSVVQDYNTSLQRFPGNILGNMFGFTQSDYFALDASDAAATQPVKVQF